MVNLFLAFGMDHVKNLKLKDLRVMLHYRFGSEHSKGYQINWNLLRLVLSYLESVCRVFCRCRWVVFMLYKIKLVVNIVNIWKKNLYFSLVRI